MTSETTKVKDATGKGFDTEKAAQNWVDKFILSQYPAALIELKRKADVCERQLQEAKDRRDAAEAAKARETGAATAA